jgi:hypothetical protein
MFLPASVDRSPRLVNRDNQRFLRSLRSRIATPFTKRETDRSYRTICRIIIVSPVTHAQRGRKGSRVRLLKEQEEKINTDAAMRISRKKGICLCVSLMLMRASASGLVQRHGMSRFVFVSPRFVLTFDRSFERIHYAQRIVSLSAHQIRLE